jgi:uncharacterized protein YgiM (DUF1202 family)
VLRKPSIVVCIVLVLLVTACDVQVQEAETATPLLVTATLPVTLTPVPSETPLPPPPQPTATPVDGVTSTQVNVRAEPSTAGNVLGTIPANTKVEITAKDPGGSWWQINYPQGVEGKGWVTAQYVTTTAASEVPILGGSAADPHNGNVAIVQQQLNIRSGPGTGFNSLATLNPQDVVTLTGKDPNGAWLQIDFPSGPEGKGWINAAFVQATGVESLPIVTETGLVVGTGTPTVLPLTPTPTLLPAWADQDSPDTPVISVIFEPGGTQTLIYNGDVSSPEGDPEDWIAFKPDGPAVFISLTCSGSAALQSDITENSLPVNTYVKCGDPMKEIPVKAGSNYLVHLQALPSPSGLEYINYTLTVKMRP